MTNLPNRKPLMELLMVLTDPEGMETPTEIYHHGACVAVRDHYSEAVANETRLHG